MPATSTVADLIDEIIAKIRASADRAAAILALQGEGFEFSEIQATEIVDMRLSTLTRLGRERLEEEMATLRETIQFLQNILVFFRIVFPFFHQVFSRS